MQDLLKRFARYEITAGDIPAEQFEGADGSVIYQMQIDDLKAVIKKLDEEKVAGDRFVREWLGKVKDENVWAALGMDAMFAVNWLEQPQFALPVNEQELFKYIFTRLDKPQLLERSEEPASQILGTNVFWQLFEDYESNKTKPKTEWEFPDDIKLDFIQDCDDQISKGHDIRDDDRQLFIRYVEELAAKGDEEALEILGYQSYGGTVAFPCDWVKARDIFEDLFEKSGDPGFANTLGYIYYYGRCTDGEPENDKAWRCFSYGAAAGVYESRYKLADMIHQGRSVPQNAEVAENIIQELYDETRILFEKMDYLCKFADVALRMGGFLEAEARAQTDETEKEFAALGAFAYYMQAKLAIDRRIQMGEYYGDDQVDQSIQEALDRVKPMIDVQEDKEVSQEEPILLEDAVRQYGFLNARFDPAGDTVKVTVTRGGFNKMLVTLPQFAFCQLTNEIAIRATGVTGDMPEFGKEFLLTEIESDLEGGIQFYSGEELIQTIKSKNWVYQLEADHSAGAFPEFIVDNREGGLL